VKELVNLQDLRIDHVVIGLGFKNLTAAKDVGTVEWEPRFGANPIQTTRCYVRSGYQPCQEKVGQVIGPVYNQTEQIIWSKPGPLAGIPDPLLTLSTPHMLIYPPFCLLAK